MISNKFISKASFCALVAVSSAAYAQTSSETLTFNVSYDNDAIGTQTFNIEQNNDITTVDISAEFKVRIFFVTAYRYEHNNTEVWENGCLKSMSSNTNDDGTDFFVIGMAEGDEFIVNSNNGEQTLTGCIHSFAYWDKDLLDQNYLLNSETGNYEQVNFAFSDSGIFNNTPGNMYRLTASNFRIDVWYDNNDNWIGLQATLPNRDGLLTYKLQ